MKAQFLAEGGETEVVEFVNTEAAENTDSEESGDSVPEFEETATEAVETSEVTPEIEEVGEVEVQDDDQEDSLRELFTRNIDLQPDDLTTDISSQATKGSATIEMNTGDKIQFSFSGFGKSKDGVKTGRESVSLKINGKKITPVVAKRMGYKGKLKDLYDLEALADFYFGYYLPDTYECFEGCEEELNQTINQNDENDENDDNYSSEY